MLVEDTASKFIPFQAAPLLAGSRQCPGRWAGARKAGECNALRRPPLKPQTRLTPLRSLLQCRFFDFPIPRALTDLYHLFSRISLHLQSQVDETASRLRNRATRTTLLRHRQSPSTFLAPSAESASTRFILTPASYWDYLVRPF